MVLSNDIARDLLEIKAVQIRTDRYFTWTSGIKSPIYCDNRLTMSYPKIRAKIIEAFVELIEQMDEKPDVIAGCATAGIPHAAWIADKLDLPMIYVRSKPKGHGKGNQIEGKVEDGQKTVVIEDLISTGGSSIDSAKALQLEGVNVLGVLAIFTYGLTKAKKQFDEMKLSHQTITNYDEILNLLLADGIINEYENKKLQEWRNEL
ncbi:orotate phosphoribosyltransferase [Virgibacillus subterraneus]|uniref:Orotate phosphoribosyltransferase n=1 Tax=Virgibacillus subterraneus TaxID=621109 RepID=A0A1H9HD82_9BACI|nr:orotate phosphoribosyltransferase [Virgibacillus subterraneus]SEQ60280.1 orotate phosphoribosyltransferase [Virgibacillus subterraneus]